MNEEFSFNKKKGMTMAKAWMLFFTLLVSAFFAGMFSVFLFHGEMNQMSVENLTFTSITMLLFYILAAIWGFFINEKEMPYFSKLKIKYILIALGVGLFLRLISGLFEELSFSFLSSSMVKTTVREVNFLLVYLPSILLVFIQIGIIGHGLLRNYNFKTAMLTASLLSLIHMEPKVVITMFLFIGVLMFFYYKIGSFLFVILATLMYFVIDPILAFILGVDLYSDKFFRLEIVQNDTLYFSLIGLSLVVLFILIWSVGKLKPIDWRRKPEMIEY